jgi:thymidylate synthase
MKQYVELVARVLNEGALKDQRAVLSSGDRPKIYSVFGHHMRFNLREGFPLVSVKRTPFKLVREELLWFLSGSTNVRPLQAAGVRFWDAWADPVTGELGPIYGKQWRRWECRNEETIDQIADTVRDIRELVGNPSAPCGRRLVVSAWNPAEKPPKAPAACHSMFQFDVTNGRLSCHLYQRSADVFLGVPFNIACYSLLTHMIAQVTGLEVGDFVHSMGDAHIYANHVDGARAILTRPPKPLSSLRLDPSIKEIDDFKSEHITIEGYDPHPPLPGEVAV